LTNEQKTKAERLWQIVCVVMFLVGFAMCVVSVYFLAGWQWGILATGIALIVTAKVLI
jgi:membrane protein YdbS with pleckstrin-like domain